jgi:plastocyanin
METAEHPVRSRLARLAAGALLVVGPLAAACSDDDEGSTPSTDDAATGDTSGDETGGDAQPDLTITRLAYEDLTVDAGQEVVVQNDGAAPHTFTADGGQFDSGTISPGDAGSVTAPDEPGDYPFHCEIHASMQATMTVS